MSLTKIKNYSVSLFKFYNLYLEDKKTLMNHPKMIEYLFYKPIHKFDNLISASKIEENDYNPTRIHKSQKEEIEGLFLSMFNVLENYQKYYLAYKKIFTEYTRTHGSGCAASTTKTSTSKMDINKYLPTIYNYTGNIEYISDALNEMKIVNVYGWTFKQHDEYVNGFMAKPYIYELDFVVDIYGVFYTRKNRETSTYKMHQIAIEYDSSTKKITVNDYLKQYYLRKMNVHLLRLNKNMKVKSEIFKFINRVRKTNVYIIQNGLKNINGLINFHRNLNVENKLKKFYENYDYNHNVYIECHHKRNTEMLSDEEYEIRNCSEVPGDEGCIVSQELFKKFLNK